MTVVLAQFTLRGLLGGPAENFGFDSVEKALQSITNFMFVTSGSVAVLFLIYGGILYMTSAGNTEQLGRAKSTITWSIVGLIVIISAFAIVAFVRQNFTEL